MRSVTASGLASPSPPPPASSQIDHSARHLLSTTPGSLEHLKEVREFFEVGMARQAAERSTRKGVARLKLALDEQRRNLRGDPGKFVAADMAFHVCIASMTGNPIFEASSRAMLQWPSRYHSGVLHWKGKETVTLDEHQAILQAIAAKDANAAAENMKNHLRRTRSVYRDEAPRQSPNTELRSSLVVAEMAFVTAGTESEVLRKARERSSGTGIERRRRRATRPSRDVAAQTGIGTWRYAGRGVSAAFERHLE